MDRLIYVAMTGAAQTLEQQATIANNLANTSTTGFRSQLTAYRAVPLQSGAQVGTGDADVTRTYAMSSTPSADFTPGPIEQTGNPLDVAVQGPGWLAVQAADGSEAYTRAGNLHVNADGQLVTASNLPVLGGGGPIAIPPGDVTIGKDGTVSVLGAGDAPNAIAVVDQMRLVNPDPQNLQRGDDGLFRTADGSVPDVDPTVQVSAGALEGSNVNTVSAMVDMISNARQYEVQMKLLSTADTDEQSANQILTFS
jgi:flagellar basal-body rod protein FlgF